MKDQCLICKENTETEFYVIANSGMRVKLCNSCSSGFVQDTKSGYWKGRKILARMCHCVCHHYDHPICPYDNQCDYIDKLQDVVYDDFRGKLVRSIDLVLAIVFIPPVIYSISPSLLVLYSHQVPNLLPDIMTAICGILGATGLITWISRNTRGSCFG